MPFRLPGNWVGGTRWLGRACPVLGSISRWKTRGGIFKNQTAAQYRFHVSRRQLNLKSADWLSLVWHAICSTETEFWQSGTPDDICIHCPFTIIFSSPRVSTVPLDSLEPVRIYPFMLSCETFPFQTAPLSALNRCNQQLTWFIAIRCAYNDILF